MKLKFITSVAASVLLASSVLAQDYESYGYENSSPLSKISINGEAGVKGRAWFGHYYDDTVKDPVTKKTKEVKYWRNGFEDRDDTKNAEMEGSAYGKLDVEYVGDITDVNVKFKVDSATVKDYPEDILEEATVRGYFGNWVLSGGKMKIVWGKGDKLHVIDNFNANDYLDFIFPEYIDRRLAEPMFSLAYSVPNASNLRFEAVVTPMMTADRFADDGILEPYAQKKLTSTVQEIVVADTLSQLNGGLSVSSSSGSSGSSSSSVTVNENAFNAISAASSFSSDDLYENDVKSLKYAQGGARMTGTLGSVDWGFSYYYGHYKQPSLNLEKYIDYTATTTIRAKLIAKGVATDQVNALIPEKSLTKSYPSLDYDRLQTFGFELATVIWKFNTRGEFAYNLTEDIAGDDPWVKNNSIAWVGGFDIDLPIHNVNFNIQETGTYILNHNKIGDAELKYLEGTSYETTVPIEEKYDVDYNSDDNYCINKIVVNVSDKWLQNKLNTECTVIYGLENKEWCVQPKIEYNPSEGLFLTLTGAYLCSHNENGEFYNFTADNPRTHRKIFGQASIKYKF